MSSTLATGFGAICSPNRNQACLIYGSTPILFSPRSGVPSRIHPHPTSPDFWSSQLTGAHAHTRLFFTVSFCQSHIDLLQLFICEEELERRSKGTQARRVDAFVGQNARLTKEFLYFSSKAPLVTSICSAVTSQ